MYTNILQHRVTFMTAAPQAADLLDCHSAELEAVLEQFESELQANQVGRRDNRGGHGCSFLSNVIAC